MPVVGLDHLDVHFVTQCPRRLLHQAEHQVDANAHVGRHENGHRLGGGANAGEARRIEAGGADDEAPARVMAGIDRRQGGARDREVDKRLEIVNDVGHRIGDGHTQRAHARNLTGVGPHRGSVRLFNGRPKLQRAILGNGLNKGAPHAPRCARDGNSNHGCILKPFLSQCFRLSKKSLTPRNQPLSFGE